MTNPFLPDEFPRTSAVDLLAQTPIHNACCALVYRFPFLTAPQLHPFFSRTGRTPPGRAASPTFEYPGDLSRSDVSCASIPLRQAVQQGLLRREKVRVLWPPPVSDGFVALWSHWQGKLHPALGTGRFRLPKVPRLDDFRRVADALAPKLPPDTVCQEHSLYLATARTEELLQFPSEGIPRPRHGGFRKDGKSFIAAEGEAAMSHLTVEPGLLPERLSTEEAVRSYLVGSFIAPRLYLADFVLRWWSSNVPFGPSPALSAGWDTSKLKDEYGYCVLGQPPDAFATLDREPTAPHAYLRRAARSDPEADLYVTSCVYAAYYARGRTAEELREIHDSFMDGYSEVTGDEEGGCRGYFLL